MGPGPGGGTPTYNHSFPGSLKQAVDHAYDEWPDRSASCRTGAVPSAGTRSTGSAQSSTAPHAGTTRDVVRVDRATVVPRARTSPERVTHEEGRAHETHHRPGHRGRGPDPVVREHPGASRH
ncbi:NAD(P)H-dependent oxidoreductase [Micromonospora echinofusca]|uniref:NAD(P)H-dependent oxidoreductase n=1 Tax=Micromonospora echinofusca TaxID=47858 RepID=UPI003418E1EA